MLYRQGNYVGAFLGMTGDEHLKEVKGRRGVPVIREFYRGRSKYDPKTEDAKHAREGTGRRIQRAAAKLRGVLFPHVTGTDPSVQPDLPPTVGD